MNTDNTRDAAEPSLASAGSHGSASRWNGVPVAWAAVGKNGVPLWLAYHRQDAQGAVVGMAQVVPLYRHPQPALTDEEREAVRGVADFVSELADFPVADETKTTLKKTATTLRSMLERIK